MLLEEDQWDVLMMDGLIQAHMLVWAKNTEHLEMILLFMILVIVTSQLHGVAHMEENLIEREEHSETILQFMILAIAINQLHGVAHMVENYPK